MIHPTACINEPPYHRDHRSVEDGEWFPSFAQRSQTYDRWHPCQIADTALIEALCVVCMGVAGPTVIGERTWLMSQVHVGHDAVIGRECELAPGTVIGGHVTLADGVRCGIGVLVRPFISVGEGARLGAGAVVVKDVPPGEVWAGNPARPLRPQAAQVVRPPSPMTESEIAGWEALAARATGP